MFMFRQRHHRPSLCQLLLVMLGFGFVARRCRGGNCEHSKEDLEATKAKAKLFRSKLKEAFSIWSDDDEEAPAPTATAEATAASTEEKI